MGCKTLFLTLFLASFILTGCGSGLCPLKTSTQACLNLTEDDSAWVSPIGVLDTSFGGTGVITTDINANSIDVIYGGALQTDGKIVVAGSSDAGNARFAVARYYKNGSLDATFNGNGKTTISSFGGIADRAYAGALIQSDGKIVAGGNAFIANSDFAVARLNSNGSLDTTFNGTGKISYSIGVLDLPSALAIQTDGKILLGGQRSGANYDFTIARHNTDGSLDTNFNTTGIVTTDFSGTDDNIEALVVQTDGKILAVGDANSGNFALARYNTNGSLDTTFNTTGTVSTLVGALWSYGHAVALDTNNKIVVCGRAGNGANENFALARFNIDGSLDTTFNTTGKVMTAIGPTTSQCYAVALQLDGKIVAAGLAGNGANNDFAIARYNTNGSLDTTFNLSGTIRTPIGSSNESAFGIAIQPNGRILAFGSADMGAAAENFALVRYR